MDDVESHIPDGEHRINAARRCSPWCVVTLALVLTSLLVAAILASAEYYRHQTRYSVAMDSVSGTDDPKATGLSFNLTLGVASLSYGSKGCIKPGTYMEVAYNGVHLAISTPETQTLCARPRKTAQKQQVLAMATAVPVGKALDDLAADVKRGTAMFDVTLHLPLPPGSYGGAYGWLSGCKGLRVGLGTVECESPN